MGIRYKSKGSGTIRLRRRGEALVKSIGVQVQQKHIWVIAPWVHHACTYAPEQLLIIFFLSLGRSIFLGELSVMRLAFVREIPFKLPHLLANNGPCRFLRHRPSSC